MTQRRLFGYLPIALGLALVFAGCVKEVPISPASSEREAPKVATIPAAEPRLSEDELAARRQQDMLANVEETPRRGVEAGMRQRVAEQPQTTTMTREEFLQQAVHFAYDSFTLSNEARSILEQKASWLSANANITVQIEGHCDERGTIAYNLALGERRAHIVKQYLVALGIDTSRLSAISYGEELPLQLGHNEEAWTQNRRAHFTMPAQ